MNLTKSLKQGVILGSLAVAGCQSHSDMVGFCKSAGWINPIGCEHELALERDRLDYERRNGKSKEEKITEKLNGRGTATFSDGRKYVGDFRDDLMEGYGRMKWPDGKEYDGSFRDDEPNGFGKMTLSDGTVQEGFFRNGEFIGKLVKE